MHFLRTRKVSFFKLDGILTKSPFTRLPHRSKTDKFDTNFSFTRSGALHHTDVFFAKDQQMYLLIKNLIPQKSRKESSENQELKTHKRTFQSGSIYYTYTNMMCFGVHKVQITCYDDSSLASGIRTTKVEEIQKCERKWLGTEIHLVSF